MDDRILFRRSSFGDVSTAAVVQRRVGEDSDTVTKIRWPASDFLAILESSERRVERSGRSEYEDELEDEDEDEVEDEDELTERDRRSISVAAEFSFLFFETSIGRVLTELSCLPVGVVRTVDLRRLLVFFTGDSGDFTDRTGDRLRDIDR